MPVRVIIAEGTAADCKYAFQLIEGIDAGTLFANRAYDNDAIIAQALSSDMQIVIPPKENRQEQLGYDKYLYKHRHLVENAVLPLKH